VELSIAQLQGALQTVGSTTISSVEVIRTVSFTFALDLGTVNVAALTLQNLIRNEACNNQPVAECWVQVDGAGSGSTLTGGTVSLTLHQIVPEADFAGRQRRLALQLTFTIQDLPGLGPTLSNLLGGSVALCTTCAAPEQKFFLDVLITVLSTDTAAGELALAPFDSNSISTAVGAETSTCVLCGPVNIFTPPSPPPVSPPSLPRPPSPPHPPSFPPCSPPQSPPVPCFLPSFAKDYAVITKGDFDLWAHNVYSAIAVGGILAEGTPHMAAVVDGTTPSLVSILAPGTEQVHFHAGVHVGAAAFAEKVRFSELEDLARRAVNHIQTDGFAAVVVDQGDTAGWYNSYHFIHPAPGQTVQGEDNGHTIVIFQGTGTIKLVATSDGRQFGPSVLAPFAHVELHGSANFVDGSIIAKTVGSRANTGAHDLQLHGENYAGVLLCRPDESATSSTSSIGYASMVDRVPVKEVASAAASTPMHPTASTLLSSPTASIPPTASTPSMPIRETRSPSPSEASSSRTASALLTPSSKRSPSRRPIGQENPTPSLTDSDQRNTHVDPHTVTYGAMPPSSSGGLRVYSLWSRGQATQTHTHRGATPIDSDKQSVLEAVLLIADAHLPLFYTSVFVLLALSFIRLRRLNMSQGGRRPMRRSMKGFLVRTQQQEEEAFFLGAHDYASVQASNDEGRRGYTRTSTSGCT